MIMLRFLVFVFALALNSHPSQSQSPQPQVQVATESPCVCKPQAEDKPNGAKQGEDYWRKALKPDVLPVWIGGVAAFLASAAGLIALYFFKRQADLMEDTARKQLRAYICLSESAVKFTTDGRLEAQMFFTNGGQTPAYDVRSWTYPLVDSYPLGYVLEDPPARMPRAVGVLPSKEKQIMIAPPLTLPVDIIERLSTRDFAFYVFGEVDYKDIFGKRHTLKYRLIFGGPAGTRVTTDSNGVRLGSLAMDVEGNEEWNEPD
jgi:hypothetical protein